MTDGEMSNMEKSTLKVLLVSPDYPPPLIGGSLVYVYNLVQNFPGAIDILSARSGHDIPEITDPRHRVIRSRFLVGSLPDPSRIRLLVMYAYLVLTCPIRWSRYDIVVAHCGPVGNSLLIHMLRMLRVPVVVIVHGEELTIPLKERGIKNIVKRTLLKGAYHRADGFVTIGEFTRKILVNLRAPSNRICIVPVMMSENKKINVTNKRQDAERLILSCGTLRKRKGFNLLIDAVASLKTEMSDLRLFIVGDGPECDALQRQIIDLKLEDSVILLGSVSDAELAEMYQRCTLFVLANVMLDNGDCEGTPTVAIEASAYGRPVVIGKEGGVAAVVDHGVTGYVVDPRNVAELSGAIARILRDPALAKTLGENGVEKVAQQHDPMKNGRLFYEYVNRVSAKRSI
jgi:glycosyltransferase involved in cell wall biosynthesis